MAMNIVAKIFVEFAAAGLGNLQTAHYIKSAIGQVIGIEAREYKPLMRRRENQDNRRVA